MELGSGGDNFNLNLDSESAQVGFIVEQGTYHTLVRAMVAKISIDRSCLLEAFYCLFNVPSQTLSVTQASPRRRQQSPVNYQKSHVSEFVPP